METTFELCPNEVVAEGEVNFVPLQKQIPKYYLALSVRPETFERFYFQIWTW